MADVVHAVEECSGQKIAARAILMGGQERSRRGGKGCALGKTEKCREALNKSSLSTLLVKSG
jgi:hypothetical protein